MAILAVVEWFTNEDKNENVGRHFDEGCKAAFEYGIWMFTEMNIVPDTNAV